MARSVTERLPIVGVMGSGEHEHRERAEPLGRWLALEGVHLLTGAGRGVMTAVSRAFAAVQPRRGMVLGIVPSRSEAEPGRPADGYPNPFVEIAIRTHLPRSGTQGTEGLSRNHINVLTAQVIIALPGGAGTRSEVELARRYGRPLVAWLDDPSQIEGGVPETIVVSSLEDVQAFVRTHLKANLV